MINKRPKVGTGVIIKKGNKVLLGKRKNSLGEGAWCFPGGHLEFKEEFEDCAQREVLEETGLKIKNLKFAAITNDIFDKEESHYITLFFVCEYINDKPKITEPDKFEKWEWFKWNDLPKPLFIPIKNLIKQKYNPFKN